MPQRRSASSRSSAWRLIIPILVLLLLSVGVGATLWGVGFFDKENKPVSREGQIACPGLARPVRAYDAITRADLINPQTGQLNVIWLPEEQASEAMLRDLAKIIGRVVSRDKQAGYILTERDLLPVGTRPGISAGIPPGKRSVTVDVKDVPGLDLLRQGDVFDLMAVLPQQDKPESNIEQAALLGGIKPPDTRSGQLSKRTGIMPLVIGGTMVAITQGSSRSTDGTEGLTVPPSGSRNSKTKQVLATLAVDPVEVNPLTEALGLGLDLYCVTRSGHPEDIPVAAQTVSLEGLVPVLTLAQPVKAFTELSQEDLADRVTGRLNLYYFSPDQVEEGWITDFTHLNGRVPARDLSRGAVITEADLMPVGTRPGVVGAIPGGMESLLVRAERVNGLDQLRIGDRFEIHSRLPAEYVPSATKPTTATVFGGRLSEIDQALQEDLETGIRILSRSAMVLQTSDLDVGSENGDKVSIAVQQEEVRSVLQAILLEHDLFAVGHSDDASDEPSDAVVNYSGPRSSLQDSGESTDKSISLVAMSAKNDDTSSETISIPILVNDVLLRKRMSVDEFIEPSTGKIRYLQFSPEQLPANVVTDLREIIGHQAGRQLYAGEWVLKDDLCEQARLSVPCDIPSDWSVIEVNSLKVRGLEIAKVGDRIDLVAVRTIIAEVLQGKAEWPSEQSKSTFYKSQREDVFTQGDVRTLVSSGLIVGSEPRIVQVPTYETKETATSETQIGDALKREGVQKTRTQTFEEMGITVWQVAVPLTAIPSLTEALAIRSILPSNRDNTKQRVNDNDDEEQGNASFANNNIDTEIALYAVLRNPDASGDTTIPDRDIISEWMARWGKQFSEFAKSERQQSKAVKTVQHIRGSEITEKHWLDGRLHSEFPEEAVESRTVETLIDRKQKPGKR